MIDIDPAPNRRLSRAVEAPPSPEPVLLIIADISGYTRYMTANAKTLAHSQTVITELIQAVVRQVELPLEVAKLEGDAIFLCCRKLNSPLPWPKARRVIGARLLEFFALFAAKLGELGRSVTCTCNACTNIERLRLKVVVHSGEALFHRVLNFTELAGVDVIIVHRLLKNSVRADQYLLLTEAARRDLEFPPDLPLTAGSENYPDLGQINTLVLLPGGQTPAVASNDVSFGKKFGASWRLYRKLWFAPFAARAGKFSNVVAASGFGGKFFFALFTALLTPFFLPVGAGLVLLHALKPVAKKNHPDHDHKADGSCCGGH